LVATGVAALVCVGWAQGDGDRSRRIARAYVLVPLACIYFYFTTSEGHGYIWLIAQRFPIIFAITAIPLLRMPNGRRGWIATTNVLGIGMAASVNVCRHFIEF